jgi:hypothetical protein
MTYGEKEVIASPFLTSTLDGAEWSVSRPVRFTLRKRTSGIHWIGRWVSPHSLSGGYGGEIKISCPGQVLYTHVAVSGKICLHSGPYCILLPITVAGLAVYGMNCLRPLEHWVRGFESHSRYGCLCLVCVFVVLCIGSGIATG